MISSPGPFKVSPSLHRCNVTSLTIGGMDLTRHLAHDIRFQITSHRIGWWRARHEVWLLDCGRTVRARRCWTPRGANQLGMRWVRERKEER